MKKYFSYLMVAFFAAMSFTLTSCSDDDDDNQSSIVGTWSWGESSEEQIYWQFQANGRLVELYVENGKPEYDYGTWSLSGSKLTVTWKYGGETDVTIYSVSSMTSDRLVLKGERGNEDSLRKVSDSVMSSYK